MYLVIATLLLHFYASWITPSSTIVSWYQSARTCLWYQNPTQTAVLLECYDQVQSIVHVSSGAVAAVDGAYRPQKDGVYILVTDSGEHYSTVVKWRNYLSVVR